MTQEIPREDWKNFFDDLTKRRFEWQTKIEVLNEDIGEQILDEGLPLIGITAEKHTENEMLIEIIVGQDKEHHQTHTIKNPARIAYLGEEEEEKPGGVVEIEETDGTKTLVYIIRPMPLVVRYVESQKLKAA